MSARFDDGVLRVTVPKVPEKAPGVYNVPIATSRTGPAPLTSGQ